MTSQGGERTAEGAPSVQQALVRAAAEALRLDAAAIVRRQEDDPGGLQVCAAWPEGLEGATVPHAGEVARLMTAGGEPDGERLAEELAEALEGLAPPAGTSALAVPIEGPDGVEALFVGVGHVPADAGSRAVMAALARAAAVDLGLAEPEESVRAVRDRMASLVEAGMALASETSLDRLLRRLVELARQMLGARYAALGVLDEEGTGLREFVWSGLSQEEAERIGGLPRGRGLLGVLIRDARPLRLDNISDDPRSVGFPPNHPPMSSFLGVPVALRGKAFGNLYLTDRVGGPFTDEDLRIAETLAAQAAVAVDNARRYQAERRRVEELESVQEVARAVLATLDLEQLLPLIARHARRLIGAETVGVALLEDDRLVFRFAHGVGSLALESLRLPASVEEAPMLLRRHLGAEEAAVEPLELGGELVGVLAAVGEQPFDDDARRLLATFSSHAGIALANARAFQEQRERLLSSAAVQAAQARERAAAEGHRRAIEAQEAERARLARELHDEAGQVLTALALHLKALEDELPGGAGRDRLMELRRSVNQAASSLREMATELRPSGLREHGLASAIERQAARLREAGVDVDVAVSLPKGLPEEVEIALFRVVQEALTNVARHSRANRASVLATAHSGRLRLVVEDDGRGFDPSAPTSRLGLAGIRERVELIGGRLRIESAPGAGTAVIVDLEVEP